MKHFKTFISYLFLVLALPFWRFLDMTVFYSPSLKVHSIFVSLLFIMFIFFPLKYLTPKVHPFKKAVVLITFVILVLTQSPMSHMASDNPIHRHCGFLTYTGSLYPARTLLSESFRDDLEARNQMCWVRKMITRVPDKFETVIEMEDYSKLIERRLFRPEIKYRATLPLIAGLYFSINKSLVDDFRVDKVYKSLHFWIDHYTDEISERDYSFWNRPFSDYIKFEYALIEKNWRLLIDNIVISY